LKVVITGSAGMLGSNVLRLAEHSEGLTAVGLTRSDFDLRNQQDLEAFIESEKPDAMIHAAAKVGGIQANISTPFDFLASNLAMDVSVIQAAISQQVPNLIYLGSSCMYPKDYRQPLLESDILAAPLEPTNEGYAVAKIAGSKMCEYATASYGFSYKTIIPSNLYGPGDNFNPGSSHLLASVIRKVHDAKQQGLTQIDMWGSGIARREFTFIEDLAEWTVGALNRASELPSVLNLGWGADHSIAEFYRAAMEVLDYEVELVPDLSKPEGMKAKLMDSSLAREKHDWNPQTDLRSGIEQTYKWFLESKDANARL